MSEDQKTQGSEEGSSEQPKKTSGGGGMIFPAIIMLVLAGWCFRDGFLVPDATSNPLFNKIGAIVLGLAGLGMLGYELLRPRASVEEKEDDSEGAS